jgi:hypothetical protein
MRIDISHPSLDLHALPIISLPPNDTSKNERDGGDRTIESLYSGPWSKIPGPSDEECQGTVCVVCGEGSIDTTCDVVFRR